MPQVNWNLLNTNAPAQVAQSFDVGAAWNQGRKNALGFQAAEQAAALGAMDVEKAQMNMKRDKETQNALAMAQGNEDKAIELTAAVNPEVSLKLAKAKQERIASGIKNEMDMHTIKKNSSSAIANAPGESILQVAIQEVMKNAELIGQDPGPGIQHIMQVFQQGGPEGLRKEAHSNELDAQDKLSNIRLVNRGPETVFAETNPEAPGFTGQPIQMEAGPAGAGGVGGSGTPYFTPIQTPEGIISFNARSGMGAPLQVEGRNVIGSTSSPALQANIAEAKKTGTGIGETNLEQYKAAEAAPNQIKDLDRLLTNLETSESITGMGAEIFKNIERAKTLMGSKVAAGKVKDTELLDTMMGAAVFPMISSLGIGARGMDTPAEREFMRSVLTGSIKLNKETLLEMTKIRKRIQQRALDKWNRRVKSGELDRFFEATGIPKGEKKAQEAEGGIEQPAPLGWTLQQDAQGNKAYVSPDGTQFQEVQ